MFFKKFFQNTTSPKGDTQVIHFLYFLISAWIICLQQKGQNFLNSNRLGVLCRFFWVIYREIPLDSLLTLFLSQLVHSKITVIRISLPLAMNLLWFFLFTSLFDFKIWREEEKRNEKKDNSKSNYEIFCSNSFYRVQ